MSTDERLSRFCRNRRQACGFRLLRVATILCAASVFAGQQAVAQSQNVQPAGFHHGSASHFNQMQSAYPPDYVSPAAYRELVPARSQRQTRPARQGIRAEGFTPYFRLNYLAGKFETPADSIIGAEMTELIDLGIAGLDDGSQVDQFDFLFVGSPVQLDLPDRNAGNAIRSTFRGEAVDTGRFTFEGANGVEGIFGIPLETGTLELSAFTFAETSDNFSISPRVANATTAIIPAIPVTDDGQPADDLAIPFTEMNVDYSINFWGVGTDFRLPPVTPNRGFLLIPSIGFRYLDYGETFSVRGQDLGVDEFGVPVVAMLSEDDPGDLTNYTTSIRSTTRNQIFGPTLGLHLIAQGDWISFSASPRLGAAVNRATTSLSNAPIFDLIDIDDLDDTNDASSSETRESELAPFLELDVSARLHLRPNFDLFAGYKLIAMTRILRAEEQIVYDSFGGAEANLQLSNTESEVVVQSIMVGGEYTFGNPSTGR